MSIGMGQASGLRLVPEARLIRYLAGESSGSGLLGIADDTQAERAHRRGRKETTS